MPACCTTRVRPAPARALDERDARVLYTLAREGDATVAFQGLRHRLGFHQQVLARTLKRLAEDALVLKADDGYRLTEDGYAALAAHGASSCAGPCAGDVLPVMHVLLPPHADPDAVADALKGRWFKDLRWFGERRAPDEITLTWITTDGGTLVRVRIRGGAVTVEAESDADDHAPAFTAVPPLLGALADALPAAPEAAPAAAS